MNREDMRETDRQKERESVCLAAKEQEGEEEKEEKKKKKRG